MPRQLKEDKSFTTSPSLIKFGKNIQHHRITQGVSIKMLSYVTGIASEDIVLLESGQRDVILDEMSIIAIALGIAVQDLVD